jgi:hypothetical protein
VEGLEALVDSQDLKRKALEKSREPSANRELPIHLLQFYALEAYSSKTFSRVWRVRAEDFAQKVINP